MSVFLSVRLKLKISDTAKQIGNIPIIDARGEAASVYVQFIE